MTDPTTTAVAGASATGIVALGAVLLRWLAGREISRLDATLAEHAASIDALQRKALTKSDLDAFESRLRETITVAVGHLSERIGDAKETARAAHGRIDRIRDGEP